MALSVSEISVGDTRTLQLFDGLTRTQLVMYSGASGDYNPLHSDEIYTTQVAGYPSIFAHGMLTMGATGRVVTDWVGAENLTRYSARFVNQVWPGDTLTATATVDAIRESDVATLVDLSIVTVNQDDEPVLTGAATASLSG